MLRLAYRTATARRSTKIAVAAVALVALGLARLNYLTEQAIAPPATEPGPALIAPPADNSISAVQDPVPVDEPDAVVTGVNAPQNENDQKKQDEGQTEWWLILAFAVLAGKGVAAAVRHLEKNGYTMKRWEDKINKKKKRDDDPAP